MSETVAGTGSEAAAAGSVAEAAAAAESASERAASELAVARESGTPPQPSHNQTTGFRNTEEEREAGKGCRQDERKLRGDFFLW